MSDSPTFRKTVTHFNEPGHAHELTFSCFQRRSFLTKDRTRQYLAEAILKAKQKHQFDVWAYVFMPEHVHLLIWPRKDGYSISQILRSIKQSVSRRAIRYLRRNNPDGLNQLATGEARRPYRFWQAGAGYDRNVTSRDALLKMIDYMHNNPVRRGLVEAP
ncbi:MAG: hypothetical protein GXP25_22350, partial [Planctomycetes bacterium]|nr:hypothetical protein [Planctomycetota bacterium]